MSVLLSSQYTDSSILCSLHHVDSHLLYVHKLVGRFYQFIHLCKYAYFAFEKPVPWHIEKSRYTCIWNSAFKHICLINIYMRNFAETIIQSEWSEQSIKENIVRVSCFQSEYPLLLTSMHYASLFGYSRSLLVFHISIIYRCFVSQECLIYIEVNSH